MCLYVRIQIDYKFKKFLYMVNNVNSIIGNYEGSYKLYVIWSIFAIMHQLVH